jgi:tight adherence protein B
MRWARSLSVAASVLVMAGAASAAAPLALVQAGGAKYPERAYLLTLPAPISLSASQVRVTENGVPVPGVSVAREGESAQTRSAVVIEVDASRTMTGKPMAKALAAARAFAVQANPDVEIAVVTFNGAIDVLQPFTYSASVIDRALAKAPKIGYGTKNYDALLKGLALISAAHASTGSIIILTDGQSVGSVAKPSAALRALSRAHVRVFAVGLLSPAYDAPALERMASATSGSYVEATSPSKLTPILASIGTRLSNEYLVRYRSIAGPGRRVAVSISVRGIQASATTAYSSPSLHIVGAAAYAPASSGGGFITSSYVMLLVVLAIVSLLLFALITAFAQRTDPLVKRVGGFVSLTEAAPNIRAQNEVQSSRPAGRRGLLTRAQSAVGPQGWSERLNETLELAEIQATATQIVVLTVCVALIIAVLLNAIVGPIGLLAALVVVPLAARFLIRKKLRNKRRAFAEQLPDNLDVLASALRAGHSLVGALAVVAEDATEPSKTEYKRVVAEEQFGVLLEDALKVCAERMENPDLEQVALVARLQREMGSNSAEVLDRVIETLRGKVELRRLVLTLTAQGRLSRWILTGLPIALALLITLIDPKYMHPLFHKTLGEVLLVITAGFVALGSFVIGKIIDIKA